MLGFVNERFSWGPRGLRAFGTPALVEQTRARSLRDWENRAMSLTTVQGRLLGAYQGQHGPSVRAFAVLDGLVTFLLGLMNKRFPLTYRWIGSSRRSPHWAWSCRYGLV